MYGNSVRIILPKHQNLRVQKEYLLYQNVFTIIWWIYLKQKLKDEYVCKYILIGRSYFTKHSWHFPKQSTYIASAAKCFGKKKIIENIYFSRILQN